MLSCQKYIVYFIDQAICYAPIKNKAHELQVEGGRKGVQFDPSGGILFTLTALTVVTVVPIQVLLLYSVRCEEYALWKNSSHDSFLFCHNRLADIFVFKMSRDSQIELHKRDYLQKLCDTLCEVLVTLDV